ncbi:MAG TPA: RimK family alpha-L-glutamate ligase [Firmicutes bacterium]|nr:RimK family alpha-L-glutamate ligase [Bacillota bacterium]
MQIGVLSQVHMEPDWKLIRSAAAARGVTLVPLLPSRLAIRITDTGVSLLNTRLEPVKLDAVVNWEPYPAFPEVEQACLLQGIPFVNSSDAVRRARNKMLTSLTLHAHGLPQAETVYVHKTGAAFPQPLELPFVYKPKTGTMGRGARKFDKINDYKNFIDENRGKKDFYFQSFIPNAGWDVRVVVVGGKVLGAIKKMAAGGEWRSHVAYGGRAEAYRVDAGLQDLAVRAAKALGLVFAGLDMMREQTGRFLILEANAVPGLRIFAEVTGINIFGAILDYLIEVL